mgnify:FL=1
MPKVFNKVTGQVEELAYDEEGMEKAKEMEQTGEGLVMPTNDARKRSEMTYG